MEVYGFTEELYDNVSRYVVVDTTKVNKININTATIDMLKTHPYLDYYQAKEIVNYRLNTATFTTISDLLHVSLIDMATFEKIKPYLSV